MVFWSAGFSFLFGDILTPSARLVVSFKIARALEKLKRMKEAVDQYYTQVVLAYRDGRQAKVRYDELMEPVIQLHEAYKQRRVQLDDQAKDQKKQANSTVTVIELWHHALNEPEESKPSRKDSIEITQIITNIPGWIQCQNLISTKWGRQKGFRKDNYAALWR